MGAALPLIIISCNPLLILAWNRVTGRTAAGLIEGFAALVSIAGVVLLTTDPHVTPLGLVLALASMVLTAIMTLAIERAAETQIPRSARNLAMGLGNVLCLAPGLFWIEGIQLPTGDIGWAAFLLSSIAMVTGIYAFTAAVGKLGAMRMSLISNAEPAVGLIAAWLIAGESLTLVSLAGALLASSGLIDWRRMFARETVRT
jgi:drug/metabolite transporter (DMT)-like permease